MSYSEEKHEPASDIDTVVVDSLKALAPKRPIREADIDQCKGYESGDYASSGVTKTCVSLSRAAHVPAWVGLGCVSGVRPSPLCPDGRISRDAARPKLTACVHVVCIHF